MKLVNLKIEKLFGIFDYDINFDNPENLTILTAPNGFGKSTILKILKYFNTTINRNKGLKITYGIYGKNKYENLKLRFDNGHIIDSTNGYPTSKEESGMPTLLITEEKLFVENYAGNDEIYYEKNAISNKIEIFQQKINTKNEELSQLTISLNKTYPQRLFVCKESLKEAEFKARFEFILKKQAKLTRYYLPNLIETMPEYDAENAKALYVYLLDLETKIAIYDELIEKIDLFFNILNTSRYLFKQVKLNEEFDFVYFNNEGVKIDIDLLSSGEMHEFVMWFTLIFETEKDMLVLIDEPETSLHVAWQKRFLDDIFEIIRLNNIQVVIATHSPQIINKHWDLVQELDALHVHSKTPKNE